MNDMRTRKVVVLPYDVAWQSAFEKIKVEIEEAIGNLMIGIEHVGSTSVAGMSAKPCIDIDVIIKDYSVFAAVVDGLKAIGYIHEGDLGIYELTHSKGFPAIFLGRRILIRKDSFHKWLEEKINDKP